MLDASCLLLRQLLCDIGGCIHGPHCGDWQLCFWAVCLGYQSRQALFPACSPGCSGDFQALLSCVRAVFSWLVCLLLYFTRVHPPVVCQERKGTQEDRFFYFFNPWMSENVWILLSNMIGHLDGPRIVGWILPLRVQKVPEFCLLEVFAPCHSSFCSSSCDLYGHWTSWHRRQPMLGIAVTAFPPSRSITESTRALGEWVHNAGGWSQGSPWAKAFRAPRPEGRCLTEGERGWGPVGEGFQQRSNLAGWAGRALSSWGRGPWSFRGSSQKRSDPGESDGSERPLKPGWPSGRRLDVAAGSRRCPCVGTTLFWTQSTCEVYETSQCKCWVGT